MLMSSIFVREIQRRNPFQIETVPWIDKIYRYPADRWPSLARQALFGAPNYLFFWLYKSLCPIVPTGSFKYKLGQEEKIITFDGRNTQYSALYYKSYAGGYEAHIASLIDVFMPDDGVFLDIGSNWGWFSLFVASKSSFQGQIHAFEPFPASYRDLQSTVSQAGLLKRVQCHDFALSDKEGGVAMVLPDKFQSGQAIMQETQEVRSSGIRAHTLDSLSLEKVSLIKMDVEGSEAKVIGGALQTLGQCKPMIVMENGRYFSEVQKTLDPLFQLHDLGYQLFHIAWLRQIGGKAYFLGDEDDSNPQSTEKLCLIPFNPHERFLRASMNVFACHRNKLDQVESIFTKFNPSSP